jgi:hypothetical protein
MVGNDSVGFPVDIYNFKKFPTVGIRIILIRPVVISLPGSAPTRFSVLNGVNFPLAATETISEINDSGLLSCYRAAFIS